MESNPKPLIVIVGATASGKTKLAIEIAKKFGGEIIAADSWTVYKDFNIGTAKPTLREQAEIKHHLIDITTADKGFSVAIYKDLAKNAIMDISMRGKLPILVGGSGLYIDSVIYDYSFLPQHNEYDRKKLNNLSIEELLKITELNGFDTTTIDKCNKRRIIRLIENKGATPTKNTLRSNTLIIGLVVDKNRLEENISKRVNQMIEDGLEQEVNGLKNKYGWDIEPMKGIGYREWQYYFNGGSALQDIAKSIQSATQKLVKKQETWLKRNKSIQWVDNKRRAVELVTTFLGK